MTIKLAIIGAGRWGQNLIKNFQLISDCEIKYVYDPGLNKNSDLNKRYDTTASFEEILDSDIDAIVIATPTSTHYQLLKEVIQNTDKHIFVEKPIVTSRFEYQNISKQVLNKPDNKFRVLMVGHVFLYNPRIRKIKEIIDSGELGDITYIHSTRLNFGPVRSDVDCYEDLIPHDISICNYLLNCKNPHVASVSAAGQNKRVDFCNVSLSYYPEHLAAISCVCSWNYPIKEQKLTIVGTKKMLMLDNLDTYFEPIKIFDKRINNDHSMVNNGTVVPVVNFQEPLFLECKHFIDCIENNQVPQSNFEESESVVKVLEEIKTLVGVL